MFGKKRIMPAGLVMVLLACQMASGGDFTDGLTPDFGGGAVTLHDWDDDAWEEGSAFHDGGASAQVSQDIVAFESGYWGLQERETGEGSFPLEGDPASMEETLIGGEAEEPAYHGSLALSQAQLDAAVASVDDEVREKVKEVVQQCRDAGVTGEYEIALWLHDWLVHNARYDEENPIHSPDGVLLLGRGVCESYTTAYKLMLDSFGIENDTVLSIEMMHIWNMVKIDGVWCHIDVTWDDPVPDGGETHYYFGMNNELLARNHQWDLTLSSNCESLQNFYPLREGLKVFYTKAELFAMLDEMANGRQEEGSFYYLGMEPFDFSTSFSEWRSAYLGDSMIKTYKVNSSDFKGTVNLTYFSNEGAGGKLVEPVVAPGFTMIGVDGAYSLEQFKNGFVLVFGQDTDPNTKNLLTRLAPSLSGTYMSGMPIVTGLLKSDDAILARMKGEFPAYEFVNAGNYLWPYLRAVGYTPDYVTFPCVFVVEKSGKITYYSTDRIADLAHLKEAITTSVADKPLPKPNNLYLANGDLTLYQGAAADYSKASLEPVQVGSKDKVKFKSSNKKVAKVSSKGVVSAVGVGEATITAYLSKNKSAKAKCKVTVKPSQLEVKDKSYVMQVGGQAGIHAWTFPAGKFSFVIKDEKIATVSDDGVITGIKKGKTYVYIKANKLTKKLKVTVKKASTASK